MFVFSFRAKHTDARVVSKKFYSSFWLVFILPESSVLCLCGSALMQIFTASHWRLQNGSRELVSNGIIRRCSELSSLEGSTSQCSCKVSTADDGQKSSPRTAVVAVNYSDETTDIGERSHVSQRRFTRNDFCYSLHCSRTLFVQVNLALSSANEDCRRCPTSQERRQDKSARVALKNGDVFRSFRRGLLSTVCTCFVHHA